MDARSPSPLTPAAKGLLALALLVCFLNFPRSIDFKDYLLRSGQALHSGFRAPPYPVGRAQFGDFFQSPIVVVLLAPLSHLPLFAAKLLWAIGSTLGVLWLWRRWSGPIRFSDAVFLLFLFAHPLSDVYLSANINFPLLLLVTAGWAAFERPDRGGLAVGGLCFALAIFIKVQPVLFAAWLAWRGEWRKVGAIALGLVAWFGVTAAVIPADTLMAWWGSWWRALALYHQSAYAGTVAYQSPPAALFRWLSDHTAMEYDRRIFVTAVFSGCVQVALFAAAALRPRDEAGRAAAFALLTSSFFLGGPYSWALTVLFLFPLVRLASFEQRPGALEWGAATLLALLPKAAWPEAVWNRIAANSIPAVCLAAIATLAARRLLSDGSRETLRFRSDAPAQPA